MSRTVGTGLARVTIVAPKRRMDVALPEHVPSAELLPGLLRHAGEGLADDGQKHGGWVLRRHDGSVLDQTRTLGAQDLRDGEVLHLVPARVQWPELDYDDIADAIAAGVRGRGAVWAAAATRVCGFGTAAGLLLLGLVLILRSGPRWLVPGLVALVLSVLLLVAGTALARAMSDSSAGAVLAAVALPYAFTGGAVVLMPEGSVLALDAASILVGSVALVVVSVVAFFAVADRTQMFVAGAVTGLFGAGAALLSYGGASVTGAAAVMVSVVIALLPAMPLLAIRIGKLPMPALPTSAEDLLTDPPMPPRASLYPAVIRSDELLTGMLLGGSLILVLGETLLVLSGDMTAAVLVAIVAAAVLLRARMLPMVRQRLPLLAAGFAGLALLVLGASFLTAPVRLAVLVPLLAGLAGLAVAATLSYSRRAPSPTLGRIADILDIVLVVAVVPVACGVLGLYGYVRGLSGSI